jgi:hypothetical protein
MTDQFIIRWIDAGLEPECAPDPKYPHGIDIDLTIPGTPACETALPYPAKRIGHHLIVCTKCGLRFEVTTAGRPDDPRSVKFPCMGAVGRA